MAVAGVVALVAFHAGQTKQGPGPPTSVTSMRAGAIEGAAARSFVSGITSVQ